uniref:Uncharacterized protein n=1 Tax=Panstrongylus lignarius TaxID=156445 RepID=A0A224Y3W8_9HEMI
MVYQVPLCCFSFLLLSYSHIPSCHHPFYHPSIPHRLCRYRWTDSDALFATVVLGGAGQCLPLYPNVRRFFSPFQPYQMLISSYRPVSLDHS